MIGIDENDEKDQKALIIGRKIKKHLYNWA